LFELELLDEVVPVVLLLLEDELFVELLVDELELSFDEELALPDE
jgi:hypothetical protein